MTSGKTSTLAFLALASLAFLWPQVGLAGKSEKAEKASHEHGSKYEQGRGQGQGREQEREEHKEHEGKKDGDEKDNVLISRSDREAVIGFFRENPRKSCPPGLAKKNNGCLPPGLAKKYGTGDTLPSDIKAADLPERLLKLLADPGKGRKYVQVDDEVLLIAEGTQLILDMIDLAGDE